MIESNLDIITVVFIALIATLPWVLHAKYAEPRGMAGFSNSDNTDEDD